MSDLNKLKELAEKAISAIERVEAELPKHGVLYALGDDAQIDSDIADINKFRESLNPQLAILMIDRLEAAEAEIARRDKAAGEPVGYVRAGESKVLDRLKQHQAVEIAIFRTRSFSDDMPLFAAQPAALPPEMECINDDQDLLGQAYISGYNRAISDAKELGAQPEKVVVCPPTKMESVFSGVVVAGKIPDKNARRRDEEWVEALKAQGFTVEGE